MSRSILFVSPHSKKIGESYVLPRLVKHAVERNLSTKFMLFNVCGEWDDLKDKYGSYIIDNPASKIVGIAPDIESINPWLNYRVWLFFVSISIFVGLPLALRKRKNIIVVARMATSAVAMARVLSNRKIRFMASMAGVPLPSAFRRRSWPLLYRNYDRVVVPCSDMIPRLTKLCNKSETLFDVIPNAVLSEDQIAMGPTFDTAPPTDNSPFKIVAVGRLTRQKGVDLLLRSLVNLPFSVHLNLIGEIGRAHV